jgi:hypothetical protein
MDERTKTISLWVGVAVLVVAGVAMLFASFSGPKNTGNDVNVIYTNAAMTIVAQQQTLEAGVKSPTPNAPVVLPTATPMVLLTPTFQVISTPLPTVKPATGGVAATSCDSAVYVSDVTIPDGTAIQAGKYFTKTWKVSNTGSCTWTATYQLTFVSGDSLGGKSTAIGKEVKPGESVDLSVQLTMTSATGKTTGTWKLTNDKGQTFGDGLTVVVSSGATATAPTATSGSVSATATTAPPTATNTVAAYP